MIINLTFFIIAIYYYRSDNLISQYCHRYIPSLVLSRYTIGVIYFVPLTSGRLNIRKTVAEIKRIHYNHLLGIDLTFKRL